MQRRPAILLATVLTFAAGAGLAAAANSGPDGQSAASNDDVVTATPTRTKHPSNHGTIVVYVDDPVTGQPTAVVVDSGARNSTPGDAAPEDTPSTEPGATATSKPTSSHPPSAGRSTTPTTRRTSGGGTPPPDSTAPPATAPPTTATTAPAPTTTTRPSGVPADWPADKPIPPKPANCKQGQLEDNGVWNCQH